MRTALGAARHRLVREMLTESIVLALGGGLLALLIAYGLSGFIPGLLPIGVGVTFAPDLTVFGFAVALSLLAGVIFGVVPALRSSRAGMVDSLREVAPFAGRRAGWLRGSLVVGQLALSFALLAVTGLLVQSLLRANAAEPGYNTRDVLTMTVSLDLAGYESAGGELFFARLRDRVAGLPGVDAVALGSNLPFAGWSRQGVYYPQERPDLSRQVYEIDSAAVEGDFFRTMQIPLLAGTTFNPSNSGADMPPVVLVSESTARMMWPDEDPVGQYLPRTEARIPEESFRVIGVVADVQVRSLREPPRPSMYIPTTQEYNGTMTVFARAAGDPGALTRPLQSLAAELDPDLGILQIGVLHDRLRRSLQDTLTVARLGGIFGVLAVVLATLGLYGVVSYIASSRTREVGRACGTRRQELRRRPTVRHAGRNAGGRRPRCRGRPYPGDGQCAGELLVRRLRQRPRDVDAHRSDSAVGRAAGNHRAGGARQPCESG